MHVQLIGRAIEAAADATQAAFGALIVVVAMQGVGAIGPPLVAPMSMPSAGAEHHVPSDCTGLPVRLPFQPFLPQSGAFE